MVTKKIYKCLIFLSLLLLYSYYISDSKMKSYNWKYIEGYRIMDFIQFEEGSIYKLKNDTILWNDSAVAVIIKKEYRWYADDILHIRSIKTGEIGSYAGK